jgi:beta-phosphoglucomutase
MIKGIIFDLDGVLVSTDEFHYYAWKMIADRENIYFDREINHRQRGVSRMESLGILLESSEKSYTDAQKNEMADTKNNEYRNLLKQLTPDDVLPGTLKILYQLKSRGIKLAVGSSSKNTPIILERTGLSKWFNAIADGNDITASKPDPQVFLIAAERLGLHVEDCLVVEDAIVGIEAARRANMSVLGIGNEQTMPGVNPCVASLEEINVEEILFGK